MATLIFKADEVKRLVDHAKANEGSHTHYGEPIKERHYLYLVHDQGVYLMSGGNPAQLVDPANPANPRRVVAYAKDCDPVKDEGWYDIARDMVGGDDFSEVIDVQAFSVFTDRAKLPKHIKVKLTKSTVQVTSGA